MKTIQQYISLMLCLPFFLVGCSDDDPVNNPPSGEDGKPQVETIEFQKEPGVFSAEGGTQDLTFTSSGNWLIRVDEDWCTTSSLSGNAGTFTVQVKVSPNKFLDERNAALEVISGKTKKIITITQKYANAILLTSNKAEVDAREQYVEVQLKTNVDFTYEIDSLAASWLLPPKSRITTASMLFEVKENDATSKREGKITFKGDGCTEVFTVYQQGAKPQLVLTQSVVVLDDEVEEFKVEVQSNTDYKMEMPDAAWLHVSESRALSSYTHYFTADANTTDGKREAEILFIPVGALPQVVRVVQYAKFTYIWLKVTGKTFTVPTVTGSKPVVGTVFWEHTADEYAPGLTHDFGAYWEKSPVNHVTVQVENVENIHFDDIRDMISINMQ